MANYEDVLKEKSQKRLQKRLEESLTHKDDKIRRTSNIVDPWRTMATLSVADTNFIKDLGRGKFSDGVRYLLQYYIANDIKIN